MKLTPAIDFKKLIFNRQIGTALQTEKCIFNWKCLKHTNTNIDMRFKIRGSLLKDRFQRF